jgi:hypothetical protein
MIKQRLENVEANHNQFHDRVANLFRAKEVEQRIGQLLAKLDQLTPMLLSLEKGPDAPLDWRSWTENFKTWDATLRELLEVAKPYADAWDIIIIHPDAYKSIYWDLDEKWFPNGDAMHDYKTFRMLLERLEKNARPLIEYKVRTAAKA